MNKNPNLYMYANNNPVNNVDPSGETTVAEILKYFGEFSSADATLDWSPLGWVVEVGGVVVFGAWGIYSYANGDTLKPGQHAGDSVPARSKGKKFTKEERDKINGIGNDSGCHTCGSTDPGTKSGNFIPDHQPPNATIPDGTPQELYPHCKTCSSRQGGTLSGMKRRGLLP